MFSVAATYRREKCIPICHKIVQWQCSLDKRKVCMYRLVQSETRKCQQLNYIISKSRMSPHALSIAVKSTA